MTLTYRASVANSGGAQGDRPCLSGDLATTRSKMYEI